VGGGDDDLEGRRLADGDREHGAQASKSTVTESDSGTVWQVST
jgi:hypothetical protein